MFLFVINMAEEAGSNFLPSLPLGKPRGVIYILTGLTKKTCQCYLILGYKFTAEVLISFLALGVYTKSAIKCVHV